MLANMHGSQDKACVQEFVHINPAMPVAGVKVGVVRVVSGCAWLQGQSDCVWRRPAMAVADVNRLEAPESLANTRIAPRTAQLGTTASDHGSG